MINFNNLKWLARASTVSKTTNPVSVARFASFRDERTLPDASIELAPPPTAITLHWPPDELITSDTKKTNFIKFPNRKHKPTNVGRIALKRQAGVI